MTGEFRSLGPAEPSYRDDPLAYRDDPLGSGSYPGYRDRGRDKNRGRDQDSPGGSFPGYADDGPPVYRDSTPPPAYRDDPLGTPRYRDDPPATSSYRDDPLGSGGYRDHSLRSLPGHRDSDPYGGDPLGSGSYPSYRDRDRAEAAWAARSPAMPMTARRSTVTAPRRRPTATTRSARAATATTPCPAPCPGPCPGTGTATRTGAIRWGQAATPATGTTSTRPPTGTSRPRIPGRHPGRGIRMTRSSRCIRTTPAGPTTPTTCGPVRTLTPCRRTARNRERPAAVPDPSPEPREIGKKISGTGTVGAGTAFLVFGRCG